MKTFFNIIKKQKHLLLLLYWPFHFMWYELIRIKSADNFYLISSSLDDKIPFCEWFIIPYVLWYFYIIVVLLYTANKSKMDFIKANIMISGSMFISVLINSFFPTGISESIRPDFATLGRENILIDTVKYIYSIDSPPRVVMPSMHVAVAVALFVIVMNADCFQGKKWAKIFASILSLLVCFSIVMIKQHSILDGFAGIALAAVLYVITYQVIFRKKNKT